MRGDKFSSLPGVVVFALCFCFPTWTWAGALYVYEMGSPADIGTTGAGMAAKAQNASTAFTNPAGMTRFDRPELLVSGVGMYLHAPFEPDNNTTVVGSDGQTNELFGGGSFSYIHPVTSRLNVGVTAQNNFGLALNWSSQWVGRYQSVNEWLIAPQVQPTLAYKVNDWLSVGGGPAFTLGYISEKKRVANLDPARGDGKLRYSDSEFAVQGNFGIMIEPDPQTRIGVRYLTETKLNFKDGLNLSNVGPIVSQANSLSLKLGVRMPQTVNVAVFRQLTDKWALLGDIGWEEWSRFGEIDAQVRADGSGTTLDLDTRDVWHFGIGAQYQYTPQWLLSAGFSYDTSMSSDANRPIILPVASMYRYGAGCEYAKSDELKIGAGLDFVWEGNVPVADAGNAFAGQASGRYTDAYFVFASVYATWKF